MNVQADLRAADRRSLSGIRSLINFNFNFAPAARKSFSREGMKQERIGARGKVKNEFQREGKA
jgi:hypothetical protein